VVKTLHSPFCRRTRAILLKVVSPPNGRRHRHAQIICGNRSCGGPCGQLRFGTSTAADRRPAAPGADQLACTTEFLKRWQVVANHVENLARRSRDSERGWLCSYTRAVVGLQEDLINFAQSDEASMRAWRMVRRTNDGLALPDDCLVAVDMSVPVARRESGAGM